MTFAFLHKNFRPSFAVVAAGFLISIISLSCNNPFQPADNYIPRLNVYSVLFAEQHTAYVRVTSVYKSRFGESEPVHGASVTLAGEGETVSLVDTTAVIDGDTASFYYAPVHIASGGKYAVSVMKDAYPPAIASVTIPVSNMTLQNWTTYIGRLSTGDLNFKVNVSKLAAAVFARVVVEVRGLDSLGTFHLRVFNVSPIDSLNPFKELEDTTLSVSINPDQYSNALTLAEQSSDSMKVSHTYVDIIVTQVDDNLYRFFITSTRTLDPLAMRTDKLIFSNIFDKAGTGIVAGASVDTTRVILH